MNSRSASQLDELLSKVLDGELNDEEQKTLAELLLHDASARRLYHDHIALHALLHWQEKDVNAAANKALDVETSFSDQARPMAMPLFHRVDAAWHGTVAYFEGHHVALAYLITTVLFAVVIAAASHVYIHDLFRPVSVASTSNNSAALQQSGLRESTEENQETRLAGQLSTPKHVGRITGEADCRWECKTWRLGDEETGSVANPTLSAKHEAETPRLQVSKSPSLQVSKSPSLPSPSLPISQSPRLVSFGDKLTIVSGLLEITFDTGAKVILQGPCRFNVETNGGFLAVGRLTGKFEKTGRLADQTLSAKYEAESPSLQVSKSPSLVVSQSPSLPVSSSAFVIATPTALVTDLGTEFGVEVDDNGCTSSHVFRGLVEIRPKTADVQSAPMIRLGKDESAKVAFNQKRKPVIQRVALKGGSFVRRMPSRWPTTILKDTFDNRMPSNRYGDQGLNQELSRRQTGLCRGTSYWCGGDFFGRLQNRIQVNNPLCPGKLAISADYGQAGWVSLNCNFQRNISVSAELTPVAVHWPDKSKPADFTRDNVKSSNWIALAIRCAGMQPTPSLLPLSQDAGAAIVVRANGRWEYFENGRRIAVGNVPASSSYRVFMQTLGDQLEVRVNDAPLALDVKGPLGIRTLDGWAATTDDNYIAIGVSNAVSLGSCNEASRFDPSGRDLHTVGNLTILKAHSPEKTPAKSPGATPDAAQLKNKIPLCSNGPK
jgi:hypothetical protein